MQSVISVLIKKNIFKAEPAVRKAEDESEKWPWGSLELEAVLVAMATGISVQLLIKDFCDLTKMSSFSFLPEYTPQPPALFVAICLRSSQ